MCWFEPLERRLLLAASGQRILFIRGGSGTGGFLDGGTLAQRDEELADINNNSTAVGNHGWGQLASLLRGDGFVLEQMIEGPSSNNTPINLAGIDLSKYSLIVFGSNNATYTAASTNALETFVHNGGGALFISDANFGSNWGDAPSSDQQFLDRFGLVMNQDSGQYALSRSGGDFLQADHPILAGVNSFDGEGVSLGVRARPVAGVTPQVIVRGKTKTKNNDNAGGGTVRDVTSTDGALVVAAAGLGRIAISFDRNTFFNDNGVGSQLTKLDNARYARNLFEWLALRPASSAPPQVLSADFVYESAPLKIRFAFSKNVAASISTSDITLKNLTTGATILANGASWDASNNAAIFQLNTLLPNGSYQATLKASGISDGTRTLSADSVYKFFVLAGDGNRNRKVDSIDLNLLAVNFGLTSRTSAQGNYDYDSTGTVSSIDFNILAVNFARTVVAAAPAPTAAASDQIDLKPLTLSAAHPLWREFFAEIQGVEQV